jgi:hypothetical protein
MLLLTPEVTTTKVIALEGDEGLISENVCNASIDTRGDSNQSDEWLGGDGNGSQDGLDQEDTQHLRSQKFKHICFVSRTSAGHAWGKTLTQLLKCIQQLTVA